MPSIIDPQTLYVDDLPTVWSPVQWELTEEERIQAVEDRLSQPPVETGRTRGNPAPAA